MNQDHLCDIITLVARLADVLGQASPCQLSFCGISVGAACNQFNQQQHACLHTDIG